MKFSALLVTAVIGTVVVADLHKWARCVNREFEGINEIAEENPDATKAACAMYKNRNTGSAQWDTCPDCSTGLRGDVVVCNSPAEHIGGDEWEAYCKQAGADYASADF